MQKSKVTLYRVYYIINFKLKVMKLVISEKNFMNTVITIKVVQQDESTVGINNAIEDAFGEFDRIVKQYTRFNENSELSNLNRNSGSWVNISDEFLTLIQYMLDLAKKTDGAFDPTIIDFLEIYGYDKNYDFSKLNNPQLDQMVQKKLDERKSFRNIEVDEENKRVKLEKGQRIDLGGIGKGYAIDCAFNKLDGGGIKNFLIDAGGDIRAKGKNDKNSFWKVDLKHKDENDKEIIIGEVELKDSSLACSGSWARKVKQFHHLINPKTGKPENSKRTVYVEAKTGIESDSWATAIFVGGENVIKNAPHDLKYFYL